jgi:hypothetical protein
MAESFSRAFFPSGVSPGARCTCSFLRNAVKGFLD